MDSESMTRSTFADRSGQLIYVLTNTHFSQILFLLFSFLFVLQMLTLMVDPFLLTQIMSPKTTYLILGLIGLRPSVICLIYDDYSIFFIMKVAIIALFLLVFAALYLLWRLDKVSKKWKQFAKVLYIFFCFITMVLPVNVVEVYLFSYDVMNTLDYFLLCITGVCMTIFLTIWSFLRDELVMSSNPAPILWGLIQFFIFGVQVIAALNFNCHLMQFDHFALCVIFLIVYLLAVYLMWNSFHLRLLKFGTFWLGCHIYLIILFIPTNFLISSVKSLWVSFAWPFILTFFVCLFINQKMIYFHPAKERQTYLSRKSGKWIASMALAIKSMVTNEVSFVTFFEHILSHCVWCADPVCICKELRVKLKELSEKVAEERSKKDKLYIQRLSYMFLVYIIDLQSEEHDSIIDLQYLAIEVRIFYLDEIFPTMMLLKNIISKSSSPWSKVRYMAFKHMISSKIIGLQGEDHIKELQAFVDCSKQVIKLESTLIQMQEEVVSYWKKVARGDSDMFRTIKEGSNIQKLLQEAAALNSLINVKSKRFGVQNFLLFSMYLNVFENEKKAKEILLQLFHSSFFNATKLEKLARNFIDIQEITAMVIVFGINKNFLMEILHVSQNTEFVIGLSISTLEGQMISTLLPTQMIEPHQAAVKQFFENLKAPIKHPFAYICNKNKRLVHVAVKFKLSFSGKGNMTVHTYINSCFPPPLYIPEFVDSIHEIVIFEPGSHRVIGMTEGVKRLFNLDFFIDNESTKNVFLTNLLPFVNPEHLIDESMKPQILKYGMISFNLKTVQLSNVPADIVYCIRKENMFGGRSAFMFLLIAVVKPQNVLSKSTSKSFDVGTDLTQIQNTVFFRNQDDESDVMKANDPKSKFDSISHLVKHNVFCKLSAFFAFLMLVVVVVFAVLGDMSFGKFIVESKAAQIGKATQNQIIKSVLIAKYFQIFRELSDFDKLKREYDTRVERRANSTASNSTLDFEISVYKIALKREQDDSNNFQLNWIRNETLSSLERMLASFINLTNVDGSEKHLTKLTLDPVMVDEDSQTELTTSDLLFKTENTIKQMVKQTDLDRKTQLDLAKSTMMNINKSIFLSLFPFYKNWIDEALVQANDAAANWQVQTMQVFFLIHGALFLGIFITLFLSYFEERRIYESYNVISTIDRKEFKRFFKQLDHFKEDYAVYRVKFIEMTYMGDALFFSLNKDTLITGNLSFSKKPVIMDSKSRGYSELLNENDSRATPKTYAKKNNILNKASAKDGEARKVKQAKPKIRLHSYQGKTAFISFVVMMFLYGIFLLSYFISRNIMENMTAKYTIYVDMIQFQYKIATDFYIRLESSSMGDPIYSNDDHYNRDEFQKHVDLFMESYEKKTVPLNSLKTYFTFLFLNEEDEIKDISLKNQCTPDKIGSYFPLCSVVNATNLKGLNSFNYYLEEKFHTFPYQSEQNLEVEFLARNTTLDMTLYSYLEYLINIYIEKLERFTEYDNWMYRVFFFGNFVIGVSLCLNLLIFVFYAEQKKLLWARKSLAFMIISLPRFILKQILPLSSRETNKFLFI